MAKHKVSELTGALLDAAVAMAEGRKYDLHRMAPHGVDFLTVVDHERSGWVTWYPSRLWQDGGPLIELYAIHFRRDCEFDGPYWEAEFWVGEYSMGLGRGATHLEAAMRAIVFAKFGEWIDLPD